MLNEQLRSYTLVECFSPLVSTVIQRKPITTAYGEAREYRLSACPFFLCPPFCYSHEPSEVDENGNEAISSRTHSDWEVEVGFKPRTHCSTKSVRFPAPMLSLKGNTVVPGTDDWVFLGPISYCLLVLLTENGTRDGCYVHWCHSHVLGFLLNLPGSLLITDL